MKSAFGLIFLCVALASGAELYERRLLGNHLEDLVRETLEYIRTELKKHDPYVVPVVPELRLVDSDVDLKISATDVSVSKAADFTIDEIKVDPLKLNAHFQVTIPTIHEEGNYKVSGTGWNKKVEGEGSLVVDVNKLVQSGYVQLTVIDHSIQVKDLVLDYSFGDYKLNMKGLQVEGMTAEEVNELLNQKLKTFLNNNKDFVAQHTASHVKEVANRLLYGHSLADVIAYFEKLVASTPDPPPFTLVPNV